MPAGRGVMGTLESHSSGITLTSVCIAVDQGQAAYTNSFYYADVGITKFGSALYDFNPSIPEAVVDITPDVRVGGRLSFTVSANIPGGAPADTQLIVWISEAQITCVDAGIIAGIGGCGIIFVNKCGDDADPGTILRPKLTVQGALTEAAGLVPPPSVNNPVLIVVGPGNYDESIVLEPFVRITSWEESGLATSIGDGTTTTITTQDAAGDYQMSNMHILSRLAPTAPVAGDYAISLIDIQFSDAVFAVIDATFQQGSVNNWLFLDRVDFLTTTGESPQRKVTVLNGLVGISRSFLAEDGTFSFQGDVIANIDTSRILGSDRADPWNQSIELFDTAQLFLTNSHLSGDIFTTSTAGGNGGIVWDDQSYPLNENYIYQGQVLNVTIIAPGTDFVELDIIPGVPSGATGIVRRATLSVPGVTNILDVQVPDPTTLTPLGILFAAPGDTAGPGSISGSNGTVGVATQGLERSIDVLRGAGDPSGAVVHGFAKTYYDTTNNLFYRQIDFPTGDTWQVI